MTYRAFNDKYEVREFLNNLPVGAQFTDEITQGQGTVYTVEMRGEQKIFRSSHGTRYSAASWNGDDRIKLIDDRNLYEKVEALRPGSIFRVGSGDPWIRTEKGVQHVFGVRDGLQYTNHEIPQGWRTYETRDITVLWGPVEY